MEFSMREIEWLNFKLFVAERTGFDSRQPHQVTANVMSFAVAFFMLPGKNSDVIQAVSVGIERWFSGIGKRLPPGRNADVKTK